MAQTLHLQVVDGAGTMLRTHRGGGGGNLPWLPVTFLNRMSVKDDCILTNVKVDSQHEVKQEREEIQERERERQNH